MAVAPDVRTTVPEGSPPHPGGPASYRPSGTLPHGGLRPGLRQVAPGPVRVTGDFRAPADGVRPDVHRLGVRTVRA